jgi:hypothetical protein
VGDIAGTFELGVDHPFPVYLPYTGFYRPTWDALYEAVGDFTPVQLDPGDDSAYLRYMKDRWAEGVGFISVEHDVIVNPGCFPILEQCPYPWCMFLEPGCQTEQGTLSLVRFRAEFLKVHHDIWDRMEAALDGGERKGDFHRQIPWTVMDVWLFTQIPGEQHPHRVPYINNTRAFTCP